jgi:hypothetical protein
MVAKNQICFQKSSFSIYFTLGTLIIIFIVYIIFKMYLTQKNNYINNTLKNIEEKIENIKSDNDTQKENFVTYTYIDDIKPNYVNPQYLDAKDRFINPLRYPYKSQPIYDVGMYPDMSLPPAVIGGGHRKEPTKGGSQMPILNVMPPVEISNDNIAPVNIRTRGPIGIPQQMGVLYKIQGNQNDFLPLFGRKLYPNGDHWEYYTLLGQNGDIKVPIMTQRKYESLGNNDTVRIRGLEGFYRVSTYDSDYPQYVPYL